jgi:arylsulfatase A-like enzyme
MHHRLLSVALGLLALGWHGQPVSVSAAEAKRPNILVILTDDQGYGDLGCYGATKFKTPRLDQLAREGTRFTSFYAQVVCGPSRSALLTGRHPVLSRGWSMPPEEVTVAELLQQAGYRTVCIGKWELSNRRPIPERMPLAQGFDHYWGPLGANDNGKVQLYNDNESFEVTDDMASLTRRYTDHAIEQLKVEPNKPFFIYLAHTMVHSVIDASEEFKGKSAGGLYGDTMEELDHHCGRLIDALDELGIADNTLVIFTSDNGPWSNFQRTLRRRHQGAVAWGSSGPLRGAKGSTHEGGLRVPCIVRWPGKVPAGRTNDAIFASIDFLPTFCELAGVDPPSDRHLDGVSQVDLLLGESETGARDEYHYFSRTELHAYRQGKWKLVLPGRTDFHSYVKDRGTEGPELYDLENDLAERRNVAADHPEIVRELSARARSYPMPLEPINPEIAPR